jgi:RimJ/RimL family protein N-acetyltransferase
VPRTAPPPVDLPVILRDGRRIRLRPLLVTDEPAYRRFVETVSPRSQYYRFFTPRRRLSEQEIDHFLRVDHADREALVATHDGEIVAVARYDRVAEDPTAAEVAFIVRDDFQGQGIAPRLLRLLAGLAPAHGIRHLVATVLPDNTPMLKVFAATGWVGSRRFEDGAIAIDMAIPPGVDLRGESDPAGPGARTDPA